MRALSVVSEIYPLIKTGGLADVAGALPGALRAEGVTMRTLVPGYPALMARLTAAVPVHAWPDLSGHPARLLAGVAEGLNLLVLDAPHLYDRPGNPYVGPDGRDFPDNALRFGALSRVAADIGRGLLADFEPDVIHAHDWQTGLVPAYLRYDEGPAPAVVFTIHNLAFQGEFDPRFLAPLGLPPRAFAIDGVEYYGNIGFLKAGILFADHVTTVSPTYAAEIRAPAGGMGLDGLLRARGAALSGVRNGVDERAWNPSADPLIARAYDIRGIDHRAVNKAALQSALGLEPAPEAPLIGIVSRLSWQKGLDIFGACLDEALEQGARIAVLGAGEAGLEAFYRDAAAANPGRVGVRLGYDEALAHLIQAGADMLVVPSRFEPCGLTQLCALRYGCVPIVARVGGLADTVIDANDAALSQRAATGIQFQPVERDMLAAAIRRAIDLYRQPMIWRRIQWNGMSCDVSWREPARRYAEIYRAAAGGGAERPLVERRRA